MKVVVDSTPLISLLTIEQIELLRKLFSKVLIPHAVYKEVVIKGKGKSGWNYVRDSDWIQRMEVKDVMAKEVLMLDLDEGESEVIILAEEVKADLVIIDELLARELASLRGLKITGTLGLLIESKKMDFIHSVKHYLDKLIENKIWISEDIYRKTLDIAGEN